MIGLTGQEGFRMFASQHEAETAVLACPLVSEKTA
jgi:hypothetical protein